MTIDCYCFDLPEATFFNTVFELFRIAVPAAVFYTLWRIFLTAKGGAGREIVLLGLDERSPHLNQNSYIPFQVRATYVFVSAVTFVAGLTISEAFKLLSQIISITSS